MVTPTKGGYVVGSVVVDPTFLERLLAASAIDVVPREPDWFLGAVVRVTGLLVQRTDEGAPEDGVQVQRRSGSWLEASRLDAVVLVTPAMMVEGALTRSKGLYAIDKVLVGRHDVAWSLGAVEEGARVRLWGQLHVQVCDPRAQCLTGGSLPIFQVGRAKRLP